MSHHYRALWLSDVHLGTAPSRASDLLDFLDQVSANTLYLVGDIIDLERLKVKPIFPAAHRAVLGRLIHMAHSNTRVVFIPGNHDSEFRMVTGKEICGIEVHREVQHETADGRQMLVFHGDTLDGAIRKGTNLEKFAAAAYTWLIEADVRITALRQRFGANFSPLITNIKNRLRSANEYIQRFEVTAAEYAQARGFDGVICGHIHRPGVMNIDGVLYANDGDWVEHRTALAEDEEGNLSLLRYRSDGIVVETAKLVEYLAACSF